MTQAHVRAIIGDFYRYRFLEDMIGQENIGTIRQKIQNRFKKLTNNWDERKNSEWVLRHYLAIKMIMSATLMINSMDYAKNKNLRIVEPYLSYYSLLTLCRSLVFTTPEIQWNNGEIMTMNHSKIIKTACNAIRSIDKNLGLELEESIIRAQDIRELYSYKFPANGLLEYFDGEENNWDWFIQSCTVIAEIAQFHSEQLQFCLSKISEENFKLDFDFLTKGFLYKGKRFEFIDQEDYYRLGYFKRKQPYPLNLYWTLREGMVDDFFGAWQKYLEIDEEVDEELFDPDYSINIIFDMP